MSTPAGQAELADRLLDELECCGDVGEVTRLMLLDALACGRLALVESTDAQAAAAFMHEVVNG